MRYFWMRGPWYMAEGGDGGAGAEAGDAAGEGGRDAAGQQGREAETATEQSQAAPDEKARKAAWKQAVQQHKDLYDQEVQSIVQKRLGKYKGMEEQMEKLSPMLRLMQQRYGVQNVEDLARAVMNDNAYYEDEAWVYSRPPPPWGIFSTGRSPLPF